MSSGETAADRVYRAFGGRPQVRAALAEEGIIVHKTTIWRWGKPADYPGGTGGAISARYHGPLLRAAKRLGVHLEPGDLVNV